MGLVCSRRGGARPSTADLPASSAQALHDELKPGTGRAGWEAASRSRTTAQGTAPTQSALILSLGVVPCAAILGAIAVASPELASTVAVLLGTALAAASAYRLCARDGIRWFHNARTARDIPPDILERVEDRIWALSEREARFRQTLDWQSEVILRRDADGALNFVNRAFCQTFGVTWDEVIGTHFTPPCLELGARTEEDCRPIERILTVRGPRWFAWDEAKLPRADRSGDDIQLVGRDVTDQLRSERELAEARDAAEAANRAKSRFLASMSHEIRTPMNGVIGLARLLSQTELKPAQKTYVDGVMASADYLRALLNDVLDFSRIEAGQLLIERKPFSLNEIVSDVERLIGCKAEAKGLSLEFAVVGDGGRLLLGDVLRLRQILVNLIDNAIKFTAQGRIYVHMELLTDEAASATGGLQYQLYVHVDDTGRGFGDVDPETLFGEFEQARTSDGHSENGLLGAGLGLSICRRLTAAMGGQISAAARIQGGARFSLTIPLEAASGAQLMVEKASVASSLVANVNTIDADGCVLIVEDNPINAMVARASVERIGFASETVSSGELAIERLLATGDRPTSAGAVFAVLLDLNLPGVSGLDVAKHLVGEWPDADRNPRPFLIALTAHAFAEDRKRCLAAGFDAHLPKPFDPDELEHLLCLAAMRTAPASHRS